MFGVSCAAPLDAAVRAIFHLSLQNWDVEYCLGYIFSVIKIFLPHPREKISAGDHLHPASPKLLAATTRYLFQGVR